MISALVSVAGPSAGTALRKQVAALVIESVCLGFCYLLLYPLVNALFSDQPEDALIWLGWLGLMFTAYAILRFYTQLQGFRAAVDLIRVLFGRLGQQLTALPLGWFDATSSGRVGRLLSQGVMDVSSMPAHLLRPLVSALVTPLTVVLVMFVFDWRLASAALFTAPLAWWTYRWSSHLVKTTSRRTEASAVEAATRTVEFAQSQAVLRAFGHSEAVFGKLQKAFEAQWQSGRAQVFSTALGLSAFVLVIQLALTVVLFLGAYLALGGRIDAPQLIALLVLCVRYVEPLLGAAEVAGLVKVSQNSIQRMDELLCEPGLAEPVLPAEPQNWDLCFEHVRFGYGNTKVLEGVSFTARSRSTTAIVGPSGSGKTTILRLAARFWDPADGEVQVGGVDVRSIVTSDLLAQISIVFQDVYLFDGSIAENIRQGRPDATDAEVLQAARLARVNEIAARLPEGLDSDVGEGGSKLSGGERQRVSIARAILKDTPIVLLDEATSALDPINQLAIQEALTELTRDRTVVIVAHRLETIRNADEILFLENGVIAERGSHPELISLGGRYAEFWAKRERAANWRLLRDPQVTTNASRHLVSDNGR
ncbi:MAG: ABC transporter ATP-binding protein [Pseudomonadota bacterium]